jgi:hypothetical protein
MVDKLDDVEEVVSDVVVAAVVVMFCERDEPKQLFLLKDRSGREVHRRSID